MINQSKSQILIPNSPKKQHPSMSPTVSQQPKPSYKYLLQNNLNFLNNNKQQRTQQQLQIIHKLISGNSFFQHYSINSNQFKCLCKGIVLMYCENPHIIEAKEGELYLMLEGQAFQYMQNHYQKDQSSKYKLYDNNEYLMVRKIVPDDFFLSPVQNSGRYHQSKKYQLMADENSLLGKISDDLYNRIINSKVVQKTKNIINFFKKIQIFKGLPSSFYTQFAKFVKEEEHPAKTKIIQKEDKVKFVYFIKSGKVSYSTNQPPRGRLSPSINYAVNMPPTQAETLSVYDTFGMQKDQKIEQEVECILNTCLYSIDKRVLAIIITSFEIQFNNKSKKWSQINISDQIHGQNYCSPEKELLNKNVERIRTSEKKVRDIRLRYMSSKKGNTKKEELQEKLSKPSPQPQQEQSRQLLRSKMQSSSQRRIVTTSNKKNRHINGQYLQQFNSTHFKHKMMNQHIQQSLRQTQFLNNYQIQPLDNEDLQNKKSSTPLRSIDVTKYKDEMLRTHRSSFSLSRSWKYENKSNKLVPKLQSKAPPLSSTPSKLQHDMVFNYLDKKIKSEILRKAQRASSLNSNQKQTITKNIKRIFTTKTHNNNNNNLIAINTNNKKSIADDLYNMMSNFQGNPLLYQIQGQRKKVERDLMMASKRKKIKQMQSNNRMHKKIRPEDRQLVIKMDNTSTIGQK